MSQNKQICSSLANQKTTVLILDNDEKKLSEDFTNALKSNSSLNNLQVDIIGQAESIPNHDVYIMNGLDLSDNKQVALVKNICKSNGRATLFVVTNKTHELEGKIRKAYKTTSPLIGSSVQLVDAEHLDSIVEYLSSVEKTKEKLSDLWCKLVEVDHKFDSIEH